jgi:hypothetical protein
MARRRFKDICVKYNIKIDVRQILGVVEALNWNEHAERTSQL